MSRMEDRKPQVSRMEDRKPRKLTPYIPWGTIIGRDSANGQYFYARNAYTPLDERHGNDGSYGRRPKTPVQLRRSDGFPYGIYESKEGFDPYYRRYPSGIYDPALLPPDGHNRNRPSVEQNRRPSIEQNRRPSLEYNRRPSVEYNQRPSVDAYTQRLMEEARINEYLGSRSEPKVSTYLPSSIRFRDMTAGGPGHSEFAIDSKDIRPSLIKNDHPWSSYQEPPAHRNLEQNPPRLSILPATSQQISRSFQPTSQETSQSFQYTPEISKPSLNQITIQPGGSPAGPFGLEFKLWLPGGTNIPVLQETFPGTKSPKFSSPSDSTLLGPQFSIPGRGKVGFEPKKNKELIIQDTHTSLTSILKNASTSPGMSFMNSPTRISVGNQYFKTSSRPPAKDMHPGYEQTEPLSCTEIQCRQGRSTPPTYRHRDWDKIQGERGKVVNYGRPPSPTSYDYGSKRRVSFGSVTKRDY